MDETKLNVEIVANAQQFIKETDKCNKAVAGLNKTLSSVKGLVKSALGIGAGVGITKLIADVAKLGDEIDKASQKAQMSYKNFQQWSYVMDRAGVSSSALGTAMRQLTKAQSGGSNAFQQLGMSAEQVSKAKPEKLFNDVVARLQQMEDTTQRTAVANELFGRSAQELIPLLNMTGEETDALRSKYSMLGGMMSDKLVKICASFKDALTDLRVAWQGIVNTLGELVLPVLQKVVEWLTVAIARVSQFLKIIFGIETTIEKTDISSGMTDYVEAVDTAEKKTKNLKTLIGGFDELNTLSKNQSEEDAEDSGTGAGGAFDFEIPTVETEMPDLELPESWRKVAEWIRDNKDKILEALALIAGALLILKGVMAGMDLARLISQFMGLFDILSKIIGVALAVAGAIAYVKGFVDAWNNGLDWSNLTAMLVGLGLAVAGLALAFGPTVASIGLIVGGIGLLIAGFKEWIETGTLSTEAFTAIEVGIGAVCIGLALLTGSWIPLLVGAIAGIALAVYQYWDEIKAWLSKAWDWLKELPQKLLDWFKEGITKIYDFMVEKLGPVGTWFDTNITQPFKTAVENIKNFFIGLWERLKEVCEGIGILFMALAKLWVDKVITPIVDWATKAWSDIKETFTTAMTWIDTKIIEPLKTAFGPAFDAIKEGFKKAFEAVKDTVKNIFNGIIGFIESGINKIVDGINGLLGGFNSLVGKGAEFLGVEWSGVQLIPKVSLPRLANGGVVNQPTVAMVGEYSGANSNPEIITPENKMRSIFEESNDGIEDTLLQGFAQIISAINSKDTSITIGDETIARSASRGNRAYKQRTGVPLLV